MRRQTRTRFSPRLNIGDGKLPNKYVVIGTDDFLVFNKGQGDWASEKLGFKSSTTLKPKTFNKYKDAIAYANQKAESMSDVPERKQTNWITVEDRLSGEVATIGINAYKSKNGLLNTTKTEVETIENVGFTKKKMEEKGVKFE